MKRWRNQNPGTLIGIHISMIILEGGAEALEKNKSRTPTALGIQTKDMSGVLSLCTDFSVTHNNQGTQAV